MGPDGKRVISIEEFLLDAGKVDLKQAELVASIQLPPQQSSTGSAFIKISRVKADLAKVNAAAVLVRDGDRILDCRLTLGSIAPTVIRAREAEAILIGQDFDDQLALRAGEVASTEIAPIDDARSTSWYRREITRAIVYDVLQAAWERTKIKNPVSVAKKSDVFVEHKAKRQNHMQVKRGDSCFIRLNVNGKPHKLWVKSNELLLNVLRDRLQLTGTKYGCGVGECGACTIKLDGEPALSCLILAISADGSDVLTVEGLQSTDGKLDPIQEAFIKEKGFQCGYCTPGMLMMVKSMIDETHPPTQDEIRNYLKGNRCRCTGFASILRSVMSYVDSQNHP